MIDITKIDRSLMIKALACFRDARIKDALAYEAKLLADPKNPVLAFNQFSALIEAAEADIALGSPKHLGAGLEYLRLGLESVREAADAADEARVARIDDLTHREFERQAYG